MWFLYAEVVMVLLKTRVRDVDLDPDSFLG